MATVLRRAHPSIMQSIFAGLAEATALVAEGVAVLLIGIGVLEASLGVVARLATRDGRTSAIKDIWLRLAGWILLSLELALGADIVRTAISPSWEDLGKLATIAAIRTVLSVFLGRDLAEFERETRDRQTP